MKNRGPSYPRCNRHECFANVYGDCVCLIKCLEPDCPFFKTKQQAKQDREMAARRNYFKCVK